MVTHNKNEKFDKYSLISIHSEMTNEISSTINITEQNSRLNPTDLFFPVANPADIVRASQKDQFYLKSLSSSIFDTVSRVLGI